MKGSIAQCLANLVVEKFGKEKWESALEKAGVNKGTIFTPLQNVDDATVLKVIDAVCKTTNLTMNQAVEAFGNYWVNTYAKKVYTTHYMGVFTAKDFLLKLDKVHERTTKSIPDAHPPRFEYEWKNDKTLIMTYKSQRGLIDFLVGLIKGVGSLFSEDLKVSKLSASKVQVIFP